MKHAVINTLSWFGVFPHNFWANSGFMRIGVGGVLYKNVSKLFKFFHETVKCLFPKEPVCPMEHCAASCTLQPVSQKENDQLIVTLYTTVLIYPCVHNQLMRTLFEEHRVKIRLENTLINKRRISKNEDTICCCVEDICHHPVPLSSLK